MRWAFIAGSNGPPNLRLQYARSDAARLADCLSSPLCGFEVISPAAECTVSDVRQMLFEFVDQCQADDDFVCYFSGHGSLHKGALYLLWDETNRQNLLSSALWISDIILALNHCVARNKLLILDCCRAGAVVMMGNIKPNDILVEDFITHADNYCILVASGRLEKTRELDELGGSFLTANLIDALSTEFDSADFDRDNRISITDMKGWLERKANEHNRLHHNRQVPPPYLFGQLKGDFYFTWDPNTWESFEIPWLQDMQMVLLPIRLSKEVALCISKFPITNGQYQAYCADVGVHEPVGQHLYVDKRNIRKKSKNPKVWRGPFYPWRTEDFQHPDKPVVCVSMTDAEAYCKWVSGMVGFPTRLPTASEWKFAAYRTERTVHPMRSEQFQQTIHHNAASPAVVDYKAMRENANAVSDMIGNIWEWTTVIIKRTKSRRRGRDMSSSFLLQGGSYFDNLEELPGYMSSKSLRNGLNTKRSNIGFRVVAEYPIRLLPDDVQAKLSVCSTISDLARHQDHDDMKYEHTAYATVE